MTWAGQVWKYIAVPTRFEANYSSQSSQFQLFSLTSLCYSYWLTGNNTNYHDSGWVGVFAWAWMSVYSFDENMSVPTVCVFAHLWALQCRSEWGTITSCIPPSYQNSKSKATDEGSKGYIQEEWQRWGVGEKGGRQKSNPGVCPTTALMPKTWEPAFLSCWRGKQRGEERQMGET